MEDFRHYAYIKGDNFSDYLAFPSERGLLKKERIWEQILSFLSRPIFKSVVKKQSLRS